MNKPILFIETPRAGKHNHRFIAPNDYTGGDGALSQWADFARQQTGGANYFGAKREAKQQSSGRIGTEQLILAGVNAKRLSKAQIETIRTFLKERLPDVERLVTQTINWEQATKIIVPRPELNQWLQELEQRLGMAIPAMPQETKSESKRRWFMEPTSILMVIGIVAFTVIIADKFPTIKDNYDYTGEQKKSEEKLKKKEFETAIAQAQRLIKAIGGNEKDVRKELAPFAIPNKDAKTVSDDWTNGLGKDIPDSDSGPWPVSMFFKNVDGNAVTTGLWGTNIDQLKIAYAPDSLQPLVQCRIAIRNLMLPSPDLIYTPFFQKEDFGNTDSNPVLALQSKIYGWPHPDTIKSKTPKGDNCYIENQHKESNENWINRWIGYANVKHTMVKWIKSCLIDKQVEYADDEELPKIKAVGKACDLFTKPSTDIKK